MPYRCKDPEAAAAPSHPTHSSRRGRARPGRTAKRRPMKRDARTPTSAAHRDTHPGQGQALHGTAPPQHPLPALSTGTAPPSRTPTHAHPAASRPHPDAILRPAERSRRCHLVRGQLPGGNYLLAGSFALATPPLPPRKWFPQWEGLPRALLARARWLLYGLLGTRRAWVLQSSWKRRALPCALPAFPIAFISCIGASSSIRFTLRCPKYKHRKRVFSCLLQF